MATFRASNTLSAGTRVNSTLTKPTGTASGDLLVMFFNIESDILPVPPTGWRFGYNIDHAGASVDQWIFWKRAGASEPASYTITHASTWTNGYIVAVQNVSPSVNPSFSTPAQGTSTTATANSVTTTGANAWVGFFVNTFGDMGTITPPAGSTPTFTERYESTNNIYAADGTLAAAGSTGTKSITFGASQQWMATMVVVEDTATTSTDPFVVQPAYSVLTASASPSVTFNVPVAENDVVVMWAASTAVATLNAAPSGWVNALGGTTIVASDSHSLACVYHKITAGEAAAQTLTHTATSLFTAAQTGYVHAALVRNIDPTTPLDNAASTFSSTNTVTPHVLAGLVGADVGTGSLVLSAVAKDATGAYSTLPSGWEFLASTDTNQGLATLRRETTTSSGVAVAATNITPSAGDEYASITVALTPAGAGGTTKQGEATGAITWAGSATGARASSGAATGAVAWVGSATGARSSAGAATGAVSWVGSATGSEPAGGSATGSVTWSGSATGTRTSSAAATGSITWSGSATGARPSAGAASGAISWVGSATGEQPGVAASEGSASGSITWAGSATGEAPVVGVNNGSADGSIQWTGSATGARPSAGGAAGSVAWTGTATGTKTTAGAASGTVAWSGSATGETPTVGAKQGAAAGVITWIGEAFGSRSSSGSVSGSISWAGEATSIVTVVDLPDGRTLVVPFHNRTLAIPAESRTVEVAAQSRTLEIA